MPCLAKWGFRRLMFRLSMAPVDVGDIAQHNVVTQTHPSDAIGVSTHAEFVILGVWLDEE